MAIKHLFITMLFVLLIPVAAFSAEPVRLAVIDFQVQSDNPQYKYLGKGFAEFISIEILKAKDITLIERDKRNRIIEEMEFSLSDLADESNQIRIGRLLAANYLVTGNIYDFAGTLSITFELVDTETSQIILKDKIDDKVSNYNSLTASIAGSIIKHFAVEAPEKIVVKAEVDEIKEVKAEEVLLHFSKAIDAYDKKDLSTAKKQLEKARKLDPRNTAVVIYLNKLVLNTSKFKTITEQYYPTQNPAYLGIIQYDRLQFINGATIMTANDAPDNDFGWQTIEQEPKLVMSESDGRTMLGYQMPLFSRMGIEVDCFYFSSKDEIYDPVNQPTQTGGKAGSGAIIAFGWSPTDSFSLGLALTMHAQFREGWAESEDGSGTEEYKDPTSFQQAFSGGFLVKNRDSSMVFDSFVGYSLEENLYFDPADFPLKRSEMEERSEPHFFNENTLTLAFNNRKSFFILKQLNDIYPDTESYSGRLLPAFEHWFKEWFSVRAGVEAALMKLSGEINWGLGGSGGFTVRLVKSGWDFDVNVAYRRRPSRFIDGELLNDAYSGENYHRSGNKLPLTSSSNSLIHQYQSGNFESIVS
jgi:TolB-like protein